VFNVTLLIANDAYVYDYKIATSINDVSVDVTNIFPLTAKFVTDVKALNNPICIGFYY
jgi:hypothetical protein